MGKFVEHKIKLDLRNTVQVEEVRELLYKSYEYSDTKHIGIHTGTVLGMYSLELNCSMFADTEEEQVAGLDRPIKDCIDDYINFMLTGRCDHVWFGDFEHSKQRREVKDRGGNPDVEIISDEINIEIEIIGREHITESHKKQLRDMF